jgi:hypothetical protein
MKQGTLVVNVENGTIGLIVAREINVGIYVLWANTGLIVEFPWNIHKKTIKKIV